MFFKEEHRNLRGGTGIVITYTKQYGKFKFSIIEMNPSSTIGVHTHCSESEVYVTFDKNIRFCGEKKWRLYNYCKRGTGKYHSAENISRKYCARMYAIKKNSGYL